MAKDPRKLIKKKSPKLKREKRTPPPKFEDLPYVEKTDEAQPMEEKLRESRGPEYYRQKTREVEEEMPHIQRQVEFRDNLVDALLTPPRKAWEGVKTMAEDPRGALEKTGETIGKTMGFPIDSARRLYDLLRK